MHTPFSAVPPSLNQRRHLPLALVVLIQLLFATPHPGGAETVMSRGRFECEPGGRERVGRNLCFCLPDHLCTSIQLEDAKWCKKKVLDVRTGGDGSNPTITISAYAKAKCKTCYCAPNPNVEMALVRTFLQQQRTEKRLATEKANNIVVLVSPGIIDPSRYSERARTILSTWGSAPEIIVQFTTGAKIGLAQDALFPWEHVVGSDSNVNGGRAPRNRQSLTLTKFDMANGIVNALSLLLSTLPQAEWFVVALDVSFIIPKNLKALLDRYDGDTFKWFGKRLGMPPKESGLIFASSGSGTVYSRTAAEVLVKTWTDTCSTASWMSDWYRYDNSDVAHAKCLLGTGHVAEQMRTTENEDYFGVYGPTRLVTGRVDAWFTQYSKNAGEPLHSGLACCAANMVSYHYVEPPLAMFLWQGLKTLLANSTGDKDGDAANAKRMIANWPKEVGPFDQKPRSVTEGLQVLALLRKAGIL